MQHERANRQFIRRNRIRPSRIGKCIDHKREGMLRKNLQRKRTCQLWFPAPSTLSNTRGSPTIVDFVEWLSQTDEESSDVVFRTTCVYLDVEAFSVCKIHLWILFIGMAAYSTKSKVYTSFLGSVISISSNTRSLKYTQQHVTSCGVDEVDSTESEQSSKNWT